VTDLRARRALRTATARRTSKTRCASPTTSSFPAGIAPYCTQYCNAGGAEFAFDACAGDEVCYDRGAGEKNSLCLGRCDLGDECAENYVCIDVDFGDGTGVCFLPNWFE